MYTALVLAAAVAVRARGNATAHHVAIECADSGDRSESREDRFVDALVCLDGCGGEGEGDGLACCVECIRPEPAEPASHARAIVVVCVAVAAVVCVPVAAVYRSDGCGGRCGQRGRGRRLLQPDHDPPSRTGVLLVAVPGPRVDTDAVDRA